MATTVFKVGDAVWHDKFGRGEVAEQGVSEVAVMFENVENNILVSTDPPPYISKEEIAAKPFAERAEWSEAKKDAPLNDHIVWWDLQISPDPALQNPRIKGYNYPSTSGYFKVRNVTQSIGVRWNDEEQRLKFFIKKNEIDINMVSTKGGQKFKVNLNTKGVPALPTARIVPASSLARLQVDPGWTLPESEEPEVTDESKQS